MPLSGTSPRFKIIPITRTTTPCTTGGEGKREVCVCRTSYQVFIDFPIRECNHVAAFYVAVLTLVLGAGRW